MQRVKEQGIEKFREEYFAMEKLAMEVAFRDYDNEQQKKKGEVLLDDEDTGSQWHNDPVQQ